MTSTVRLPLLFLDADGPLIPFGASEPYPTYETGTDRSWVAVHHPGPALLHRVEPRQRLRDGDYAVLDVWLRRRAGA